ncbi:hypothetical protein C0991_006291 [Blastosporella zonata]|nr:hypothetical protein C0991_006291 [Blastosporella zonata]
MLLPRSLLALWLAISSSPVIAASAGTFADGGSTLVSAMMMFLGNTEKIYILDKAEGNSAIVNGHSAWASVWDIATQQATVMDVTSNTFCSSGMHLPNGSYVTFGGNSAVGRGGVAGSAGNWDSLYQDFDGSTAIRVLNPCTSSDDFTSTQCQWFEDANVLAMQRKRWYSSAEALADGSIVLIGGFVGGGYINRNTPNTTAVPEAAENTYEFYPDNGRGVTSLNFLYTTGGLNAYAHAFLLNSGNMLVQANVSTMIWDYTSNTETDLPNMPGNVVRVYPASGAVAMLPLTPSNNYNPTILFCGGNDMTDAQWGNYSFPAIDTWNYPASTDCQRLTPEPLDGSAAAYEADDDMLEGRSMGQFIILPDGKMLVVNGALNGTAGYALQTGESNVMPYGMSLAGGPVGTPALYDPNAPAGQRWTNAGFASSSIARMYHSSAMLLPDGSVLIAGSNPNVDVNTTTYFNTEYRAEIFYPEYFSATTRPVPSGIPSTISYGGDSFDITIPPSSYAGSSNAAALNTTVVLLRGGFTTHAMNMGQRYVQLNNTYTVQSDGTLVLHVAQAPNPNILQPGPALFFVAINGIPSNGTLVIVGSGNVGVQPTSPASVLPASITLDSATGSADSSSVGSDSPGSTTQSSASSHLGLIIGAAAGGAVLIALIIALSVCIARKRKAGHKAVDSTAYAMTAGGQVRSGYGPPAPFAGGMYGHARPGSTASSFQPLHRAEDSDTWNGSTANLSQGPYRDEAFDPRGIHEDEEVL